MMSGSLTGNAKARDDHWWLLLVLTVVVAGFWPSLFRHMRAQDVAHSLHGFTATGWLVGLIGQAWLVSRGQRIWHRRVALAMIPTAIAMIVTAVPMMRSILRAGLANADFQPLARELVVIDVHSLLVFTGLLSVGLANVRRSALHRRALPATAMLAIPPALSRLLAGPLVGMPFPIALHGCFALPYGLLGWLIWRDRRDGVSDRVYPVTLALIAALQVSMGPVSTTAWWIALTDWMAR